MCWDPALQVFACLGWETQGSESLSEAQGAIIVSAIIQFHPAGKQDQTHEPSAQSQEMRKWGPGVYLDSTPDASLMVCWVILYNLLVPVFQIPLENSVTSVLFQIDSRECCHTDTSIVNPVLNKCISYCHFVCQHSQRLGLHM